MVHIWISTGDLSKSVRIYEALLNHESDLKTDELNDLKFDLIGELGGWRRVSAGVSRSGSLNSRDEELDEIRSWMFHKLIALKTGLPTLFGRGHANVTGRGNCRCGITKR